MISAMKPIMHLNKLLTSMIQISHINDPNLICNNKLYEVIANLRATHLSP